MATFGLGLAHYYQIIFFTESYLNSQEFILQGLPGVGSERAARLLESFGSVAAVMTATSEELQFVEGIGNYIAERIKWAVSEKIQSYGVIDKLPI